MPLNRHLENFFVEFFKHMPFFLSVSFVLIKLSLSLSLSLSLTLSLAHSLSLKVFSVFVLATRSYLNFSFLVLNVSCMKFQ